MHKQLSTWKLVQSSLQQKIDVILLYVLQSKGSSPGRQGFFMAVNADGQMSGSLGGGIMEHKFIEMGRSKLRRSVSEVSLHVQLHDKEATKNRSGMICSGEQTIFLYTVQASEAPAINSLIRSMEENRNGTLQLSPGGIFFSDELPRADFSFQLEDESNFIYTEKTGYKNFLYIIGGGHCALSFSQLMSGMDFYIRLFDHRTDLNTIGQNHFVHETTLVDDYSGLSRLVSPGENSYVVIMTFGYRTDETALKALIEKDLRYLGILGSENKIKKMFGKLAAEGVEAGRLSRIHAPVGIQINSRTTEEIAISIAAEIIQVKNAKKPG